MTGELLIIIALVFFEGFFSGSEIAFLSAPRSIITALARDGNYRAKLIVREWKHAEQIIAASIAGTTICVIAASTVAAQILYKHLGAGYEFLTGLILSPFIIILGEILPKDIAYRHSTTIALLTIIPLKIVSLVIYPFHLLIRLSDVIFKTSGEDRQFTHLERREIVEAIDLAHRYGSITTTEKRMSLAVMALSETLLKEVMTPIVNVHAVEENAPLTEVFELTKKYGHSKIPVFSNRVVNITGYVRIKDIYRKMKNRKDPVKHFLHPILYLPETMPCDAALFTLAHRSEEIAVVVDEYGGAAGIITLIDLVEELTGTLEAKPYENIHSESPSRFIINGQTEIEEVEKTLNIRVPDNVESVTIAGFLIELMEKIPAAGEEILWGGYRWRILSCDGKRIEKIEVEKVV